jgi:hypothetical protein
VVGASGHQASYFEGFGWRGGGGFIPHCFSWKPTQLSPTDFVACAALYLALHPCIVSAAVAAALADVAHKHSAVTTTRLRTIVTLSLFIYGGAPPPCGLNIQVQRAARHGESRAAKFKLKHYPRAALFVTRGGMPEWRPRRRCLNIIVRRCGLTSIFRPPREIVTFRDVRKFAETSEISLKQSAQMHRYAASWFCFSAPEKATSRHRLEALEPQRKPISIKLVLHSLRQMDCAPVQSFQRLKHRAVTLPEQPLGHMQLIIRVDADQMRVERRMMNLRKRDPVRNHRLAELFGYG